MSDLLQRPVAVIGGAGFIGLHVCRELKSRGAGVVVIDTFLHGEHSRRAAEKIGAAVYALDARDGAGLLSTLSGSDLAINLATVCVRASLVDPTGVAADVNALGAVPPFVCARAGVPRYVYVSSSEVYGEATDGPLHEGSVPRPQTTYGAAKLAGEHYANAARLMHGIDVVVVRPFNSILADEQVLYDDGVSLRREPIGILATRLNAIGVTRLDGFAVPSFAADGRVVPSQATHVVGHPYRRPCYEVRTRYGRSVRVTGDHSLFVRGTDGAPVEAFAHALRIGQEIACTSRISVPERDRAAAFISDAWLATGHDPWRLVIDSPGLADAVFAARDALRLPAIAASIGSVALDRYPRRYALRRISDACIDNRPNLWMLQQLKIGVPFGAVVRIGASGSTALPNRVTLTDDILWFLGLLVAEGTWLSDAHDAVITASSDDCYIQRAIEIMRRDLSVSHILYLSPSKTGKAPTLRVSSRLLVALLHYLEFDSATKGIPGWVLGLPLPRLKYFMDGYRCGDGVHSGKMVGKEHHFNTVSDTLKDDLVVALGRFGLFPSIGRYTSSIEKRYPGRRYPFWRLSLYNVIPWSPLEWDAGVKQRLNARRFGDLVWCAVRSIIEVPATPLVYDFAVPNMENFLAGTGVMCHNTYGSGCHVSGIAGEAIPRWIAQGHRQEVLTVHGDGSQTRDFTYVTDIARGIVDAALSDAAVNTGPINLCSGIERTMASVARDILSLDTGTDVEVAGIDGLGAKGPRTALTAARPADLHRQIGCNARARVLLRWEPRVAWEEGLRLTREDVLRRIAAGEGSDLPERPWRRRIASWGASMTPDVEAMIRAADPGGSGSTIGCYKFLHYLASVTTPRHERILEIGTHVGLSSAVMAHGAPTSVVHTVDTATGAETLQDSQWREFGVYGRVMRHVGDSREVVPAITGAFDLAFIDGGHADDVVQRDYENLRDRSPVIAFHDAYENVKVLASALRERAWVCVESRPGTLALRQDWRGCRAAFVDAYPGGEVPVWTRGKITNRAEPGIVVLIALSEVP